MNILITGASGGVGQALIEEFANDENTLFLHAHKKTAHKNSKHNWIFGDLTEETAIESLRKTVQTHDGLDVIIHAASHATKPDNVLDKEWLAFHNHLQLQTKSLFLLAKQFVPSMRERGFGRIIGIATEYTVGRPSPKLADYVTAKYAMVGLIKSLAIELGKDGITCNCISPGTMITSMTDHLPRKLLEIIANNTPTRKLTSPKEVAQLAAFLCSPAAAQITGENIVLSGGNVME